MDLFSFSLLRIVLLATVCNSHWIPRNKTTDHNDFLKFKEKLPITTLTLLNKYQPDLDLETIFNKLRHLGELNSVVYLTEKEHNEFINKSKTVQAEVNPTPAADSLFEQNEASGLSELLLEGDVFPSDEQLDTLIDDYTKTNTSFGRKKRNAAAWQPKWTLGIVYYEFSPEIAMQPEKVAMIYRAFAYIQDNTCITFQQGGVCTPNRIRIIKDNGCYSQLGMIGGVQTLSLPDGCGELFGTIVHEFIHALGFWHTQNRHDRDTYLTVNTNNIDLTPQQINTNFGKKSVQQNINYTPYEYGSTMHYPPHWWSKPGTLTFMPTQGIFLYAMGSRIVTFYDMKMINDHYQCHARCDPATSAPCKNGGYPNPNNCQQEGCGQELTATTNWQSQWVWFGEEIRL